MMLDTMFQHPSTVQCALFVCKVLRALYLFKESTPIFLLARRVLCVQNQLGDLFLKVLSIF